MFLLISIGSLGKDNSTGMVTKVVLDTAFLRETTNGLRIKTWQVILCMMMNCTVQTLEASSAVFLKHVPNLTI
jgi:hypothetical protein